MAWKQLRQPDLSVVGRAAYCLVYARQVFSIGPAFQTAWAAWKSTEHAHEDRNFPPVAIPVWFAYPSNGTVPGHVAVRLKDGKIYSSPLTGTGHLVLDSIEEVERRYKSKYVGWSEDLNNVRVAQEDGGSMTDDNITQLEYGARLGREANQGELDSWRGRPTNLLITSLASSPEAQAYYNRVQAALKGENSQFVETKVYVKKG